MNKVTIVWVMITLGVVISLFFVFFSYFGISTLDSAISGFIIGEIVVLTPFYILFFRNIEDK